LGNEELSQVDSVYLNPPLISIVMTEFGVDSEPEMGTFEDLNLAHWDVDDESIAYSRQFPAHSGT